MLVYAKHFDLMLLQNRFVCKAITQPIRSWEWKTKRTKLQRNPMSFQTRSYNLFGSTAKWRRPTIKPESNANGPANPLFMMFLDTFVIIMIIVLRSILHNNWNHDDRNVWVLFEEMLLINHLRDSHSAHSQTSSIRLERYFAIIAINWHHLIFNVKSLTIRSAYGACAPGAKHNQTIAIHAE